MPAGTCKPVEHKACFSSLGWNVLFSRLEWSLLPFDLGRIAINIVAGLEAPDMLVDGSYQDLTVG